ncbi:hypothetical protein Hanom_Chr02g00141171 [Helianthus anomalus]
MTDGDLVDRIYSIDLTMLKKSFDQEKGNTRFIRRALHSLSKAGEKMFIRIALTDFDIRINYDQVTNRKVLMEKPRRSQAGVIFEETVLLVVFRDHEEKKSLFRDEEICKYSNQTLKYIKDCMNKK